MEIRNVAKCIIINDNKEFLIFKRSDYKKETAGLWDIPGGKVEENESIIEGVIREVKEESNLDIISPIEIWNNVTEFENIHQTFYIFKADYPKEGEIKISEEATEYKWIKFTEIDNYDIYLIKKNLDFMKEYLNNL